jgi:hypothetical protein
MPSIWPCELVQAHSITTPVAYIQCYYHFRDGQFALIAYEDLVAIPSSLSPGDNLISLRAPPLAMVAAQGVDGYQECKA